MLNLRQYHKPTRIEDALELLKQPGTVALAGGTELIAEARRDVQAVVDLSVLGLSFIREQGGSVTLGATTTLAEMDESPILRVLANGVLAQAAHRSAGSVLRHQATLVGTLISEPDGILAATLLALDATATALGTAGKQSMPLGGASGLLVRRADLLREGALMTEVALPLTNPRASLQTVARTPRDKPIVSVCAAARLEGGVARDVRVALGGVAPVAVRAGEAESSLEGKALNKEVIEQVARAAAQALAPQGDFRGSAEYRREMAAVLARRALREVAKSA